MRKNIKYIALLAGLLVLLAWFPAAWGVDSEPIVIIVNKANNIASLKASELARIYRGEEERWPDGQRIVLVNRPATSEIRDQFYSLILKVDPSKKFFKKGSPIPYENETMIAVSDVATRKFVARIPGAIGYVYQGTVDETVKAVKIE